MQYQRTTRLCWGLGANFVALLLAAVSMAGEEKQRVLQNYRLIYGYCKNCALVPSGPTRRGANATTLALWLACRGLENVLDVTEGDTALNGSHCCGLYGALDITAACRIVMGEAPLSAPPGDAGKGDEC